MAKRNLRLNQVKVKKMSIIVFLGEKVRYLARSTVSYLSIRLSKEEMEGTSQIG